MSLENLIGRENDNLAIKPFVSILREYSIGNIDAEGVILKVNKLLDTPMVAEEESDVLEVIKKLDAETDKTGYLFGLYLTLCLTEYDATILSKDELKDRYFTKG
jgi:hypothetical protein